MLIEFLTKTADVIGIIGVFLLLLSYFLLNTERMSSKSMRYQLLNFFGAALIMYSLVFDFNLSAFVIEIAWMTISLIGMLRILKIAKTKK